MGVKINIEKNERNEPVAVKFSAQPYSTGHFFCMVLPRKLKDRDVFFYIGENGRVYLGDKFESYEARLDAGDSDCFEHILRQGRYVIKNYPCLRDHCVCVRFFI